MNFVVDTNVLYSYFWKRSVARKVLLSQDIELSSPEFALEELNKYKADILHKTKITGKEFDELRFNIALAVNFKPVEEYKEFLKQALKISPDRNDIDFFALALKLKLPLWSNDSKLKGQNKVQVFSTSDLIDKFYKIIFPDN